MSDGPAGFLLSWVAGFVDVSAFIILFGIFTAHVTGNIALAGYSFVYADEESVITHLVMLPVFILTVAGTSLLARFARRRQWPVFAILLTAEAIALTIFSVSWGEFNSRSCAGCSGRVHLSYWYDRG